MSSEDESSTPPPSPFFRALQAGRYERQEAIRTYEESSSRSLIVFNGPVIPQVITPLADALNDIERDEPLDLMVTSLGGDGETAFRMASMCHSERGDLKIIVPDIAASAATLLALAAETIVMSNASALGPVDPQVFFPGRKSYIAAKDIVEIVEGLDQRIQDNPQSFELYASLLADIDMVVYQSAVAAIRRISELVPEVLKLRQTPPSQEDTTKIVEQLQSPAHHSATISYSQAEHIGLPVSYLSSRSEEWDMLWRLHTRYVAIQDSHSSDTVFIEGRRVSFNFCVT